MSVTLGVYGSTGASGWTTITASAPSGEGSTFSGAGTRKVYVSNSAGNDANDGSSATPLKTLAAGLALLRNGSPDWLLLKKGDTWTDERLGFITQSGLSATEPMLISAYGTGARPLIKYKAIVSTFPAVGFLSATNGNFFALIGIEFYDYTRDPANPSYNFSTVGDEDSGLSDLAAQDWFLVEDCKWSFGGMGIGSPWGQSGVITDAHSGDIIFRRNVVVNNYQISSAGHGVGIFITGVDRLVFEENVFDHNGWNESVSGGEGNIFSHNVYLHGVNGPATVRGNISARASSHGFQVRAGGTVYDNLLVRNPVALIVGCTATVDSNVVLEANDINNDPATLARGWGLDAETLIDGITVPASITITNNILAHEASTAGNGNAILIGNSAATSGITATGNVIYDWESLGSTYIVQGSGSTGNTVTPNAINSAGYSAPTRSVGSYDSAVMGGPGTLAHFLSLAALQSKDNWDSRLTANAVNTYIRAGFGIGLRMGGLRFGLHS